MIKRINNKELKEKLKKHQLCKDRVNKLIELLISKKIITTEELK